MDSTQFLVTLDEMKDFLQYDDDDTDRDNNLGLFINLVSTMTENYTQRKFIENLFTEYYNGTGNDVLLLKHYPITDDETSIEVWVDLDREFGGDSLLDSDDIIVDQDNGMLIRRDYVWPLGQKPIKVTYGAGYTEVPYDLRLATMEAVAYFWKRRNEKTWGVSSVSKSETNITRFESKVPQTVRDIWERYRKWR